MQTAVLTMVRVQENNYSKRFISQFLLILTCFRCLQRADTLAVEEQLSSCSCKTNQGTIDLSPLDIDPKPR